MCKHQICIIGALSFVGGSVAAAEFSPEFRACMVRAHEQVAQVNLCSQQELVRLDDRLNKAFTELLRQSDAEHARGLRLEERRWIKKRDYDCKVNDMGTVDNNCMLNQTSSRADELQGQLKF